MNTINFELYWRISEPDAVAVGEFPPPGKAACLRLVIDDKAEHDIPQLDGFVRSLVEDCAFYPTNCSCGHEACAGWHNPLWSRRSDMYVDWFLKGDLMPYRVFDREAYDAAIQEAIKAIREAVRNDPEAICGTYGYSSDELRADAELPIKVCWDDRTEKEFFSPDDEYDAG